MVRRWNRSSYCLFAYLAKFLEKRGLVRRRLQVHELRFHPEIAKQLLEWLGALPESSVWTEEMERKLHGFRHGRSHDDWLEDETIEAAERFGALLKGEQPKEKGTTDLAAMREELLDIAKTLRTAL